MLFDFIPPHDVDDLDTFLFRIDQPGFPQYLVMEGDGRRRQPFAGLAAIQPMLLVTPKQPEHDIAPDTVGKRIQKTVNRDVLGSGMPP